MKLSLKTLKENKDFFTSKGYKVPEFDIESVTKNTHERPTWIHFGAGNIFKIFQGGLCQELLNKGEMDTGIVVCETFNPAIVEQVFKPYDNLFVGVSLKGSGEIQKEIIGSIVEAITKDDMDRIIEIVQKDSLQMLSMTITEKGYRIKDANGELFPYVVEDMANFGSDQKSLMGLIAFLCYKRFEAGKKPLTLVSLDNLSHNGDFLQAAVCEFAKAWSDKGSVPSEFVDYVNDKSKLSFTWSMIDKITPAPNQKIADMLTADDVEGMQPLQIGGGNMAAFVNAEELGYLAIEDAFVNGRPPLDKVGVMIADRDTIDRIEKMKVCTCLNPLHTVLAVYGCLLGYNLISAEMKDAALVSLIKKIGYDEALPVVVSADILDPKKFIDEVINERLPNPYIPDMPQRIAMDTSLKVPVRFGETIKSYIEDSSKDVKSLKYIPLFVAGWLRYLMGIDDAGNVMECSSDPRLDELSAHVKDIKLGDSDVFEKIKPIITDKSLFGVDLCEVGLDKLVLEYFQMLIADKNAVRQTLDKLMS